MAAGVNELRRFDNKSLYSAATLNELSGQLASDPLSVPDTNKSPQSDRVADYADQLQQDGGDRFQFLSLVSKLGADKEVRVGEMNDLVTKLTRCRPS